MDYFSFITFFKNQSINKTLKNIAFNFAITMKRKAFCPTMFKNNVPTKKKKIFHTAECYSDLVL